MASAAPRRRRTPPSPSTPSTTRARPPTRSSRLTLVEIPHGAGLLVVKRGPNSGARYLLGEHITRAGRHPESDIFLDDITVSRRHAEITPRRRRHLHHPRRGLAERHLRQPRTHRRGGRSSPGDEVQIGKFKFSIWWRATSEQPHVPLHRGRPDAAARGVPRRDHLEDPLPREPGSGEPRASPSGYRKFFEPDVERLRWVLRQQREHFLPLKVIRDRLGRRRPGRGRRLREPAAAGLDDAARSIGWRHRREPTQRQGSERHHCGGGQVLGPPPSVEAPGAQPRRPGRRTQEQSTQADDEPWRGYWPTPRAAPRVRRGRAALACCSRPCPTPVRRRAGPPTSWTCRVNATSAAARDRRPAGRSRCAARRSAARRRRRAEQRRDGDRRLASAEARRAPTGRRRSRDAVLDGGRHSVTTTTERPRRRARGARSPTRRRRSRAAGQRATGGGVTDDDDGPASIGRRTAPVAACRAWRVRTPAASGAGAGRAAPVAASRDRAPLRAGERRGAPEGPGGAAECGRQGSPGKRYAGGDRRAAVGRARGPPAPEPARAAAAEAGAAAARRGAPAVRRRAWSPGPA